MFLRMYTGVTTWWDGLKTRAQDEGGATAVEYALMVALIAVVIIAAVAFIGKSASSQFNHVGNCINTPSGTCQANDHNGLLRPLEPPGSSEGSSDRRLVRDQTSSSRKRRHAHVRKDVHGCHHLVGRAE